MSLDHNLTIDNNQDNQVDNRQILILYGSETGNSEDTAGDLGRLAERLRFRTLVCEMNDVELSALLRYPLVIFVISTTGQGEIPQNALKFWKSLLRKRLPPGCLRNLNFTTFGLGDSSYSKYNWAVRKLHKRLEQLGAIEFFPRGEADERHEDGIDTAFLPWSTSLRAHLEANYPLPEGLLPIPSDVPLPPKYTIELLPAMGSTDVTMSGYHDAPNGEDAQPVGSAATNAKLHEGDELSRDQQDNQQDNQQQVLDDTAALYSHPDTRDPEILREMHQAERMKISSTAYSARLSENTANRIAGGIDILDRPNVLRDHPTTYSLQDTDKPNETAPDTLLPIPGAWRAIVEKNERVTPPDHWQDVRHLTLRVFPREQESDSGVNAFAFVPGDIIVLYPKNFPEDVQALIDLMGWGDVADKPFQHHSNDYQGIYSLPKKCFPVPRSTLRDLLLHNYDITSIPKRVFFEVIAFYTNDPTHQERLKEFANPAFSDEFYDYTSRPRRSILEVLQDFPSVQIPYQHIPSLFPVIRGREYSIASGGDLQKDHKKDVTRVELLVALVKYKTVLRKTRQGLCSRYLASLRAGTTINIGHKEQGNPELCLETRPLLAIGPGTGIAPIRSLIWDRQESGGIEDTMLFFGGRNRDADYFFEKEWEALGIDVFTAFSRDQRHKIYVQDRIREQAVQVCDILKRGAMVYLCGSSGRMPKAVRNALYDAMVIGGMAPDQESARSLFHSRFIYLEEVW
ncbi:riboflavin synthase domain-like protein [Biscogniauxia mediterranea]|nr:riboflavin synthase domain-like protein [Biscogniauxia mediterranea]